MKLFCRSANYNGISDETSLIVEWQEKPVFSVTDADIGRWKKSKFASQSIDRHFCRGEILQIVPSMQVHSNHKSLKRILIHGKVETPVIATRFQ